MDIENAFDGVPRKLMEQAKRKIDLSEAVVRSVPSLHQRAKTKNVVEAKLSEKC